MSGTLRRTAALSLLIAGTVLAQHALDAGLMKGSRTNYTRPRGGLPPVQKPIYTLDRGRGTMVYNRANAFNDPTYSIYQRYTQDRFSNFTPAGVATGASVTARAPRQPTPIGTTPSTATPRTAPGNAIRSTAAQPLGYRNQTRTPSTAYTRVATSSYDVPTNDLAGFSRPSRYISASTSYAGTGLGTASYSAVTSAPLPPLPEKAVSRPPGYSVTRDDFWAWR